MQSEKGGKRIEKIVRLKKHVAEEAGARVAEKNRVVQEKEAALKKAEEEMEALSEKAAHAAEKLRGSIKERMKICDIMSGFNYVQSLENHCIKAWERVEQSRQYLKSALLELEKERKTFKEKSVEKRSAEKYLTGVRKKARRKQERKEPEDK